MSNWRINAWSSPDHADLVAEVYIGDEFVCLIDQEDGVDSLRVEWSSDIGKLGRVSLAEFEDAINRAKLRLIELRRVPPASAP